MLKLCPAVFNGHCFACASCQPPTAVLSQTSDMKRSLLQRQLGSIPGKGSILITGLTGLGNKEISSIFYFSASENPEAPWNNLFLFSFLFPACLSTPSLLMFFFPNPPLEMEVLCKQRAHSILHCFLEVR